MSEYTLKTIRKDNRTLQKLGKVLLYVVLIALSLFTLIPFVWMLSASLKLDREVFAFPMKWIPETFHWETLSSGPRFPCSTTSRTRPSLR